MENILVSIRVRPLRKQEASKGSPWKLMPKTIALSSGVSSSGQTYNFDRVFDPKSKTADIYDAHTKKIISSAVHGFNGTIFAYGQTNSGKTYTMRGTSEEQGIIPLAIQDVFRNIELAQNREFLLRVSYMEIYNEDIKDLLAPENCKLQIHENFERGIFVAGLREEIVVSPEQVLALMDFGEAHRHVGETNMNVHSSRSHAIFRMVIESRDRSQDLDDPEDRETLQNSDPVRVSHLNLVDLAGSERVAKTGAEGARLKEGTHINKSLMILGNVINKLSEGIEKQGGHVPYRDSKLTRILQPALGGNARTVIICNITPALVHVEETKGTLHFASRANRVTNCAQVNEIVTDAALLKRQKKEIAELRQKLQNQESPSDHFEEEILNLRNELLKTELERERMASELQEFQKAQAERERRIKEQEQKIESLSTMVINYAVDDREIEKRSRRSNRRETWCARPQSGLPLLVDPTLPDRKIPCQKEASKTPKIASSELPIQVNKERSFGLPPPFEALMEDDEDMFTRATNSSFDVVFYEQTIDNGLLLSKPGHQSTVADKMKRSSNEWIVGNEFQLQLLDLEGQCDTMQCLEKDSEIGRLKRELLYTQLNLSKPGEDNHKKAHDPDKRDKGLDGWIESESTKIKQLHAQVGKLEAENLYMERKLQRSSEQAEKQTETSKEELEQVHEELNLAKETLAKLNAQLGKTLQDLQELQMEKLENEYLYAQLFFALKDLKTEVDDIREPFGGLPTPIHESLQHPHIEFESFEECLAGVRDLSAFGHTSRNQKEAKLPLLTSKAGSLEDCNPAGEQSVELDDSDGCDKVRDASSKIVGTCPHQHGMNPDEKNVACPCVKGLPCHQEDSLNQLAHKESQADENGRNTASEKTEEWQLGDHKECDVKDGYSVSVKQEPIISIDVDMREERVFLLSAVDNCRVKVEHFLWEKQSLLLWQTGLQNAFGDPKGCLQGMKDQKNWWSDSHSQERRIILLAALNSLDLQIELTSSKKHSSLLRKAVLQKEHDNRMMQSPKSSRPEAFLQEVRNTLPEATESLHMLIEHASLEKQNLLVKKAAHQEELGKLEACLQVMEVLFETIRNLEGMSIEFETGQSINGMLFPEFELVCHEYVANHQVAAHDSLTSQEAELSQLKEQNSCLRASLANAHDESQRAAVEWQTSGRREFSLVDKVESFKVAFQSIVEDRNKYMKASDESAEELGRLMEKLAIKLAAALEKFYQHFEIFKPLVCIVEGEVDWAIDELKSILKCVQSFFIFVEQVSSQDRRFLLGESAPFEELHHPENALGCRRSETHAVVSKIRSSPSNIHVIEDDEDLSALVPDVERLSEGKRTLDDRVRILNIDVLKSREEIDMWLAKEASLVEEVTNLKSYVEEIEDDRNLWMKVSEVRLADINRQIAQLDNSGRKLLLIRKDHADAVEQIADLKSLLSQKLDEVDGLSTVLKSVDEKEERQSERLKDLEEEKKTLAKTVSELDTQLQAFTRGASEALQEMECRQQQYQTESSYCRAEVASLRRELSTAKTLPDVLLKEKGKMYRLLEKTKFKMKDTEAKLKATIQAKGKLETENGNIIRELKHLRQSNLLQRDISRRDSVVDQRRQSLALDVSKTKNQLNSAEHALQSKMEEVENLTYELSRSQENYAKLEFAMAEADGYFNEKLAQLQGALAILKEEKTGCANSESRHDVANEQYNTKANELESLRTDFMTLTDNLQESEGGRTTARALVTIVTKEKEDVIEELLDAHIIFQRQKAELTAQAQESKEKCEVLDQKFLLLTEELQKLKESQEEASDANRILQDKWHRDMEINIEKPLTRHKLLMELEADLEYYKGECRELQQHLQSAQKHEYNLRFSGSLRMEQLRLELQQCTLKLLIARDEERILSQENRSLLLANTKLQFAFDATRDRLEIFENRLDESDWELTELKNSLQKVGFDGRNLVTLQHFEQHMKAQTDKARGLETELGSKAMVMRALEVHLESTRAQCQKYELEIQYLNSRVLTSEQETGVRAIVQQNKILQSQLKKAEDKAQELDKLVKGNEVSLGTLQTTVGSIQAQNAKLQKDLAASKAELEFAHMLQNIPMRPQVTSQCPTSLPSNSGSPVFKARAPCTMSSISGDHIPLVDLSSNDMPCNTERKRPQLFPSSEWSKLSRSLGLKTHYFTLPESHSHGDLNKENFTLH